MNYRLKVIRRMRIVLVQRGTHNLFRYIIYCKRPCVQTCIESRVPISSNRLHGFSERSSKVVCRQTLTTNLRTRGDTLRARRIFTFYNFFFFWSFYRRSRADTDLDVMRIYHVALAHGTRFL